MLRELVPDEGRDCHELKGILATFAYRSSMLCDLLRCSKVSKHADYVVAMVLGLLNVVDECTAHVYRYSPILDCRTPVGLKRCILNPHKPRMCLKYCL